MNVLKITTHEEFRAWLSDNHATATECWIVAKKGKTPPPCAVWYLDAVEEALCFGWIDTTHKRIDGEDMQKFTPRSKKTVWSELNKARVARLEKLGLMTEYGRKVLPDESEAAFVIDEDIMRAFAENPTAWQNFCGFPELYRKVRIDTIQRDKKKDRAVFDKRLEKLVAASEKNVTYGEWNDYGRLLDN